MSGEAVGMVPIPEAISNMQGAKLMNRINLASFVVTLYDIILTLDDEVEHVWSMPRGSLTKWVFLFVRYFPLVMQVALLFQGTEIGISTGVSKVPYCVFWLAFQFAGAQVTIAAVEVVLMMRVFALYDRSTRLVSILSVIFLIVNAGMATAAVDGLRRINFTPICVPIAIPRSFWKLILALTLFEFLLLVLTLWKSAAAVRAGWGHMPLVVLLVRDGSWAFLAIFLTFVINMVYHEFAPPGTQSALFNFMYSIPSFAACWLVLNLHTHHLRCHPSRQQAPLIHVHTEHRRAPRDSLRQRARDRPRSAAVGGVAFTSHIAVDDITTGAMESEWDRKVHPKDSSVSALSASSIGDGAPSRRSWHVDTEDVFKNVYELRPRAAV